MNRITTYLIYALLVCGFVATQMMCKQSGKQSGFQWVKTEKIIYTQKITVRYTGVLGETVVYECTESRLLDGVLRIRECKQANNQTLYISYADMRHFYREDIK